MEFTLSFCRINDRSPVFTLTIDAALEPSRLVDFDGGQSKIAPDFGYESYLKIRAVNGRNDRVECYYQDNQGNDVVAVTVAEDGQLLQPGASLQVAIEPEVTWTEGKILYCSWLDKQVPKSSGPRKT